jgi:hypothetical protein
MALPTGLASAPRVGGTGGWERLRGEPDFPQYAGQMKVRAVCLLDWQARIGQGAASRLHDGTCPP